MEQKVTHWRMPLLAVLGLVAGLALLRAVWLGLTAGYDLEIVLTSARAWWQGLDVYEPETFRAVWDEMSGERTRTFEEGEASSLYPPSTYVLFAPLSAVGLPMARMIWTGLNVAALVLASGALAKWVAIATPSRGWVTLAWIFLATMLLYAVQTHFRFGQTAIVSVALMLWALATFDTGRTYDRPMSRGRWVLAVLAAGTAVAIKPQLALPLLGYAVLRGWWAATVGSVGVALAWLALGWGWMAWHGQSVFPGLPRNVQRIGDTGISSAKLDSVYRHQLINTHVLVHALIEDARVVAWVVRCLVGVVALSVAAAVWKHGRQTDALAALSAIAALSLMVTYHRGYDAVVLMPAVAWCVRELVTARRSGMPRPAVWVTVVLLLPLATPGGTLMTTVADKHWLPDVLRNTWAWNALLVPFQAWSISGLSLWFAWLTWRGPSDSASED
ncbi:MAG: glycosyltransferase family 87 protein [Planctomycetota bacterium]